MVSVFLFRHPCHFLGLGTFAEMRGPFRLLLNDGSRQTAKDRQRQRGKEKDKEKTNKKTKKGTKAKTKTKTKKNKVSQEGFGVLNL